MAIIDGGRVIALDTPVALSTGRGGTVEMTFATGGADVGFLRAVPGVESISYDNGTAVVSGDSRSVVAVASALGSAGLQPEDFRTRYPTLEDVFLSLTGRTLRD